MDVRPPDVLDDRRGRCSGDPGRGGAGDGRAAPLEARAGLAPAYVLTAGLDPLRDEGRVHADALEAAGVAVVRVEHGGQIHGFVRMTAVMAAARPALHDIGAFLRDHLAA